MKTLAGISLFLLGLLVGWALATEYPLCVTLRVTQTPVTNSIVHLLILTQPGEVGTKLAK